MNHKNTQNYCCFRHNSPKVAPENLINSNKPVYLINYNTHCLLIFIVSNVSSLQILIVIKGYQRVGVKNIDSRRWRDG